MQNLRLLIRLWSEQLWGSRERLGSGADEPDAWRLRIRERITRFLIGRYRFFAAERPGPPRMSRTANKKFQPRLPELIPEDRPPRRRSDLGPLLADIRTINVRKRPRWRWW